VKTVTTDSTGAFSTALPPGDYVLTPEPHAGGQVGRSVSLSVVAGVVSEATLAVETGIR
jgi:hypothetical protein